MTQISRWRLYRERALDAACDVLDVVGDTTFAVGRGLKRAAAAVWRPIRENARELIPSRAVRWTVLYVPAFTVALLFALNVFGGLDDLQAYVLEVGVRSLPVLVAIAITYGLATGLGWNLDNEHRETLQTILVTEDDYGTSRTGAFLVLAGEMLSILSLLALVLAAMLVWQG